MTANGRAALLMSLGMALFAFEDLFLKILSGQLPVPQLLAMFGILGTAIFVLRLHQRGLRFWTRDLLIPSVLIRTIGELIGGFCFVAALSMSDLSATSAILQTLPLALVMGGALFLGETVGWRRWSSVLLGFIGVLMILRPGTVSFQPPLLLALIGVAALAMRDLVTRLVPAHVASDQLSAAAYAAFVPGGAVLMLLGGQGVIMPTALQWVQLVAAVLIGAGGYAAMVVATREGQASVIAPFRYLRLLFSLVIAAVALGERPDGWTLAGAALIAASGGYAMWREAQLGRRARPRKPTDSVTRPGG